MMEVFALWVMVAVLTEGLTEVLKNAAPNLIKDKVTFTLSIAIGVVLAYAFSLNPFGLVGAAAHASTIAAGLLASRGANYLNGFLSKLDITKKLK